MQDKVISRVMASLNNTAHLKRMKVRGDVIKSCLSYLMLVNKEIPKSVAVRLILYPAVTSSLLIVPSGILITKSILRFAIHFKTVFSSSSFFSSPGLVKTKIFSNP